MAVSAYIDTDAHPLAPAFYHMFPHEPILPKGTIHIPTEKITKLPKMSVENLLQQIIRHAGKNGEILIVSHGTTGGLLISVGPSKNNVQLSAGVLQAVNSNLANTTTDKDAASILKMKSSAYTSFKALVQDVQKLALKRVEFRACLVGGNEYTMHKLRIFFGAATVTGPTMLDAYGSVSPGKFNNNSAFWEKWLQKHPGAIIEGKAPNRLAFHLTYRRLRLKMDLVASSASALQAWVTAHLPNGQYKKGILYFHFFTLLAKPIFPGDKAFRKKLYQAVKGNEPSLTIDLDDF